MNDDQRSHRTTNGRTNHFEKHSKKHWNCERLKWGGGEMICQNFKQIGRKMNGLTCDKCTKPSKISDGEQQNIDNTKSHSIRKDHKKFKGENAKDLFC